MKSNLNHIININNQKSNCVIMKHKNEKKLNLKFKSLSCINNHKIKSELSIFNIK